MKQGQGISITLAELIRARPAKGMTGFAPAGRVATHQWGSNPSVFKGRGMEFAESRIYQAGDDVRNIDWRVTARTGNAHTKLFQEERERPIQILLDLRAMMHFGTRVRFKSHLAAEVAAQFAWAAFDGGDRLGGQVLTDNGLVAFRPARTRTAVLRFLERIASESERLTTQLYQPSDSHHRPSVQAEKHNTYHHNNVGEGDMALSTAIARLRRVCRPGTLVFIISDFGDFDTATGQELTRLANHAHITAVQVNDALDSALPPRGGRLTDGQQTLSLASLSARQLADYTDAYNQRQQHLATVCAHNGVAYHRLQTTDSASSVLYKPSARQRGGKTT